MDRKSERSPLRIHPRAGLHAGERGAEALHEGRAQGRAELRQPLGVVMVGGLLVSQVLTLFTTPVVYLFFDRLAGKPTVQPVEALE